MTHSLNTDTDTDTHTHTHTHRHTTLNHSPDQGHWGPHAKQSVEYPRLPPSSCSLAAATAAVVLPESRGQWCTVRDVMPHHEVEGVPPDHILCRICLVGLEAGEAHQMCDDLILQHIGG